MVKQRISQREEQLEKLDSEINQKEEMFEAQIVEMADEHAARLCACRGDIDEAI